VLSDATDLFQMRGHARTGLAEVLALAGKREESVAIAAECVAIHNEKGDVAGSALARRRFERMGIL
jgi:hypothetical protein